MEKKKKKKFSVFNGLTLTIFIRKEEEDDSKDVINVINVDE